MSSPEALLPLSWSQSLIEHRHNAKAGLFLQDAGYVDSWTPISLAEILLAVCCSLRLCPPSSLPSLCPSPGQTCAGVWWLPLPDRIPPLFLLQTFPQQFFYTSNPILWPLLLTGPGVTHVTAHRPPAARSLLPPNSWWVLSCFRCRRG